MRWLVARIAVGHHESDLFATAVTGVGVVDGDVEADHVSWVGTRDDRRQRTRGLPHAERSTEEVVVRGEEERHWRQRPEEDSIHRDRRLIDDLEGQREGAVWEARK